MKSNTEIRHYKNKYEYASKAPTSIKGRSVSLKGDNIKSPGIDKVSNPSQTEKIEISKEAKDLAQTDLGDGVLKSAVDAAKDIVKSPPMPPPALTMKLNSLKTSEVSEVASLPKIVERPAIFFISGFDIFNSSSDSMKQMTESFPGAKHFGWSQKQEMIEEIRHRGINQPVVLVGSGLGANTAVKIANELNNVKNGFRKIDLLVTIDSAGFASDIIPQNVKENLNVIGEHGSVFSAGPHIAKNTKYTSVVNELVSGEKSISDAEDVHFQVFEKLQLTLAGHRNNKNTITQT